MRVGAMTALTAVTAVTEISFTESRPSEILASLHDSATDEREFLFASHDASAQDLIVVAWADGRAVGYVAASDERPEAVLIWEHLVVPDYRGRGVGRRLLLEAAKRAPHDAEIIIDPMGTWAMDRLSDYYGRLGLPFRVDDGHFAIRAHDVVTSLGEQSESSVTISDLLSRKQPGVAHLDPAQPVAAALDLMDDLGIGALVASSDASRVEGLFAERDLLRALRTHGEGVLDAPLRDHMTTDVLTATPTDALIELMDTMTTWRVRHVPITDSGHLVGIVSVGDLLLFRLEQLDTLGTTLPDRRVPPET